MKIICDCGKELTVLKAKHVKGVYTVRVVPHSCLPLSPIRMAQLKFAGKGSTYFRAGDEALVIEGQL